MQRTHAARRCQREVRQRKRQHRVCVRRPIVLPAIEQILEMKTGFRFALHHQATLKEQCIGILPAQRQFDEIPQRAAHRNVRLKRRRPQPRRRNFEGQRDRRVIDAQAEPLSAQLAKPSCEQLSTQQMVHGECDGVCMHRRGNEVQQAANDGGSAKHDLLHKQFTVPSCHGGASGTLIHIKPDVH